MMQRNPPRFLCCIILTPPTQHLYLGEAGMWCLTITKSDSDAFSALCSSVYKSLFAVTKLICLRKKAPDKHQPLLLCLQKEEGKI